MNIFEKLFVSNISLDSLIDLFGYEEEEVIDLIRHEEDMTDEERKILDQLLNNHS